MTDREQRHQLLLLVRQVEHDRHIGVELAGAAAHDGAAVAQDVPGKPEPRAEVVLAVRGLALVVVAHAEIQREVVGDPPLVLEEGVVAAIAGEHVEAIRALGAQRDVELRWVGRGVGGIVRRVGAEEEGAGIDGGARGHLVEADAAAGLEGVLAARGSGRNS